MKRILILFTVGLISLQAISQTVTLSPTISPALFHYNDQITVTYDVTGTSLASLSSAYLWTWMPGISGSGTNATSNINPASSNAAATNPAKFTKSTANGKTLFSLTFTPSAFFAANISSQLKIGMLLKGNDWANGQSSDFVTNFLIGSSLQTTLSLPSVNPLFVNNGDTVIVQATASPAANFKLYVNNVLYDQSNAITTFSRKLIANDSVSSYACLLVITSGGATDSLIFGYLFRQQSPVAQRPVGIIDGINYNNGDPTRVTLSCWAPGKKTVYAFGDFSEWLVSSDYLMNKDGEHFWVELTGLTPGKEYAFQYLVNDTLKIADPYTDKTLSYHDDELIPATTYPHLKPYPARAINSQWYYNRLSVFQTGQTPYAWKTASFSKPPKEKLVVYELLLRDFFDSDHRSFQSLIDTIGYFKRLGVNAIELMPVTEFNGGIGWGYNPTFMFAVQKYYGPKDKLKEFVDKCHASGIAVIMDLVLNHQDIPNAYAMLDFDFGPNFRPKPSNKWFNVTATHPFSVLNDMNHDSPYTRKYVDTVNYYWMHEFRIDGFRYDLSKGFTQTNSGGNVGAWGNYDQSRVNNLTRMADVLWSKFPDAYIILEHFADNSEEKVLANYQVDQGRGMMLWGNFNYAYNQATMGYNDGTDISSVYYGNKGWSAPRLVGYMESHDEERLMYKNLQFGNAVGPYSIKLLETALMRMKGAALMFYPIPGPKMLWQFGELGYDQSINECVNGTVDTNGACRLDPKPVLWNYDNVPERKSLWYHVQDLLRLRKNHNLFTTTGVAQITSGGSLVQQLSLTNTPYSATPADSTEMNAQIAVNQDVSSQQVTMTFPHSGTWYDYYNNGLATVVTNNALTLMMGPGTYKLYTDVRIHSSGVVTGLPETIEGITMFPNPVRDKLNISSTEPVVTLRTISMNGLIQNPVRDGENTWDVSGHVAGIYIVEIRTASKTVRIKLIKR